MPARNKQGNYSIDPEDRISHAESQADRYRAQAEYRRSQGWHEAAEQSDGRVRSYEKAIEEIKREKKR